MPSLLSGRTRNVLPNVPGWSFASNGVFGNVNGFASVWTQTPAVSVVNSVPRPGRARALTTTTGKTAVGAPVFGSKLGGAPGGGGVGGCVLRGLCGAVLIVDDDVAAAGGAAAAAADVAEAAAAPAAADVAEAGAGAGTGAGVACGAGSARGALRVARS